MGNESIENQSFFPYKEIVGTYNLHSCDISFAVAHEAKFTKNPQMQHIATLKCIMKYLEGTVLMKITYNGSSKNHVLHS
jgi:hypothetical protein